jgi:3D (Asp-Asp-Asp) domain-containing protein
VLASHVVRPAEAGVIAIGTAVAPSAGLAARAASFASAAQQGLASAVRFAGNAIHMIATAYTAGCYGCSGITASGQHAGWGIVAVDPRVIPLGTKLFIPGYGHAVAGDTGGAINGNRIDLGMDTIGQALQFGRRDVTVYVIR